jgi:hypothetical protein
MRVSINKISNEGKRCVSLNGSAGVDSKFCCVGMDLSHQHNTLEEYFLDDWLAQRKAIKQIMIKQKAIAIIITGFNKSISSSSSAHSTVPIASFQPSTIK